MNPRLFLSALFLCTAASCPAVVISQWNFNGTTATAVPGGTSAPTPSTGSGTASLVGGTSSPSFNSASADGGSSDPVLTTPADYAWQTSSYPAATVGNETAGVQFAVSTVGYENIVISYDLRHSNSASRYEAVQYSIDGTNFTTIQYFTGAAGDTWFNNRTVDLSAIPAVNNNPNFTIRIVAAFETAATGTGLAGYRESQSAYATTGSWRFDMVTINSVPEPSASLLGLMGGAALLRRRRS